MPFLGGPPSHATGDGNSNNGGSHNEPEFQECLVTLCTLTRIVLKVVSSPPVRAWVYFRVAGSFPPSPPQPTERASNGWWTEGSGERLRRGGMRAFLPACLPTDRERTRCLF